MIPEGRVLRFFESESNGLLYVAVVDLAQYLHDVASMERAEGHEACANIVAGCALALIDGGLLPAPDPG